MPKTIAIDGVTPYVLRQDMWAKECDAAGTPGKWNVVRRRGQRAATLRDIAGDPLNGGSLVFNAPPLVVSGVGTTPPLMYNAHAVDVQQLHLMLIPLTASGGKS